MLRFPMTACPVIQDNSYPLVQDECPPVGEAVSRISITHEATVLKTITRPAASSMALVDRTSGFWNGAAESILSLVQTAAVLPVRFGVASNTISLSQTDSVSGGGCPCGATILKPVSDVTVPSGNDVIVLVDASSGQVQVTLPDVAAMVGKMVHVKKIDSSGYAALVVTPGSETIDSLDEQRVEFQWNSMQLSSDGTNWYIL